jgi:hypothetical protein
VSVDRTTVQKVDHHEWLWRALRRAVTHNHQRQTLDPLLVDADQWATALSPERVLSHIGSPFAPDSLDTGTSAPALHRAA